MKKLLVFAICICLSIPMASCSNRSSSRVQAAPTTEITATSTSETEGKEGEYEMPQDVIDFGLTINNIYYPIPSALKQFLDDGWSISSQTPYFLQPMVSEDYYEMRADLSLSEDGKEIRAGGSIIRLLEKDGVLLEVTIANQSEPETDDSCQKIEDGIVDAITVFYDEAHTSIRLNNMELSSITPESLLAAYPVSDGWTHAPSNYSDYPEFGIATDYEITKHFDDCNRLISVYFNLENTAFKITALSEIPPKHDFE